MLLPEPVSTPPMQLTRIILNFTVTLKMNIRTITVSTDEETKAQRKPLTRQRLNG